MDKVKNLGQVFTEEETVETMLELRKNSGSILEPSCGPGAFSDKLKGVVAIEFDSEICPQYALNMDFFDYDISNKFNSVIGNPPFVGFKEILNTTKAKLNMDLFDKRSNLYMFFIYKSILHLEPGGELIFINPREFLKATSSVKLNEFIYNQGTITDIVDIGDQVIFPGFSPNCVIFRFEKDNFSRKTNENLNFICSSGQLLFTSEDYPISLEDLFEVRVGAVSAADDIFSSIKGNKNFVYSKTTSSGKTRRMLYNKYVPELEPFKERLLNRGIKKFDESNWWKWGRGFYVTDRPRIYVNCKTRNKAPFFIHPCKNYDGSILALFPKKDIDLAKCSRMLNSVDWNELGFMCGNRFIFSQRSLQNSVLPKEFEQFL